MKKGYFNRRAVKSATAIAIASLALTTLPAVSNNFIPEAYAVTSSSEISSGVGDITYKPVTTNVIVNPEFKTIDDFLTYLGSTSASIAFAVPVDGKPVNQIGYYDNSTSDAGAEYDKLSSENKLRAQFAKSILSEVYLAEYTGKENISGESLAKLKELGVTIDDKDSLTAIGALLMAKALDNDFDVNSANIGDNKTEIVKSVDELFSIVPTFTNQLGSFGKIAFNTPKTIDGLSNGTSNKVFIPSTVDNQTPALTISSYLLPDDNGDTQATLSLPIKIAGVEKTGIYSAAIEKNADSGTITYADFISLDNDPTTTDINSKELFPNDTKSSDSYDKLSDENKKEAYLGATLVLEGHYFGTDGKLRDDTAANLKLLGIDNLTGDQIATLGQLLMLDAYHDDFDIDKYLPVLGDNSSVLGKAFENAKQAASKISNDITGDHLITRTNESETEAPQVAYSPSDNKLLKFSSLSFGSSDSSDNSSAPSTSSSDNSDDLDNSDDSSDITTTTTRSTGSDAKFNSDSDGGAGRLVQGTPVQSSTLGNDLQQARANYSGTYNGGVSSSVDGESEEGAATVDTGGHVQNSIVNIIRSIFR